jgi:RNA polymerase sigma factor (sigma-70 family)
MTLSLRSRDTNRAFERLYRTHVGDVYRYALAVTGNRSDAEDVTQTTFMQAYRALDRGEHPVKPRNWLITVAHNVCRQRFRETARRPIEVEYDEDVGEALVPSDDAPTAADIQRALGQLAMNQREALVMRELEGRSYAEIAETLGLSVAAVETLIFRARRALREQLEGTLSCSEAEAALSLQLDGRLSRADAGLLRGHLRACESCRRLARRQRAQRKAVKGLAAVPVPPGLAIPWLAGGSAGAGAAGLGAAVAVKVAAVTVAAAVVGGGGYAVVRHETATHKPAPPRAASAASVAHAATHHVATTASVSQPAASVAHAAAHHVATTASGSRPPAHPVRKLTPSTHTRPVISHKTHPARSVAPTSNVHAHSRTQGAVRKPRPVTPAHHANAASKSRACRTRPTVTTPAVTTVSSACPSPAANGKSHAKQP